MTMAATIEVEEGVGVVALCAHCAEQRMSDLGGPELEKLDAGVVSGVCHDCGGGFCMCRGALSRCDICPRKNAPVVVSKLTAYAFRIPPAAPTVPSVLGSS